MLEQARKLGRCDSYLQNPKTLPTHPSIALKKKKTQISYSGWCTEVQLVESQAARVILVAKITLWECLFSLSLSFSGSAQNSDQMTPATQVTCRLYLRPQETLFDQVMSPHQRELMSHRLQVSPLSRFLFQSQKVRLSEWQDHPWLPLIWTP